MKRILCISLCFVFVILVSCDKNITNNSPIKPYSPSPEDNQENVSLNTVLTWICGDPEGEQVTYDVYFSTNPELTEDQMVSEGQISNSFYPGQLDFGRRYNWKIVARDPHNNISESHVWKFTTKMDTNLPPNTPSDPTPADNSTNLGITQLLQWECTDPEGDPLTYDVYLGTNPDPGAAELVAQDLTVNDFNPGALGYVTTYYWKIVAHDDQKGSTSGPIWKFTTIYQDVTPPSKVTMTPHKCDPGDPGCAYTDRNNGIDAYPAGNLNYNWMKIQWDDTPLQTDGDIHHIEVWRFNEYGDTAFVEQIPFIPDSSTYYDKFIGYEEPVIQKTWSYFIIPFDEAGNFTNSDTVSYRLIEVPGLQAPINNGTFSVNDSIDFSWSAGIYTYRILFFDTSHNYVYSEDTHETSFNISEIDFVPIPGYSYIWRIDAFFIIGQAIGSESEERIINFTQ